MRRSITGLKGQFGRMAIMDLRRPLTVHAHPQCHCLIKLFGSDGDYIVGGEQVTLDPDTALLVRSWEPHSFEFKDGQQPHIVLAMYIDPHWLDQSGEGRGRQFAQREAPLTPEARKLISVLRAEILHGNGTDQAIADEVLPELMDEFETKSRTSLVDTEYFDGVSIDRRVRRAAALIRENLSEPLAMDEVAREVGVSRQHFFELFRRDMQVTPLVYQNTVRMEHAVQQLVATSRKVADIGLDVGFSAAPNFSRFFVMHAGVTPQEYRSGVQTLG